MLSNFIIVEFSQFIYKISWCIPGTFVTFLVKFISPMVAAGDYLFSGQSLHISCHVSLNVLNRARENIRHKRDRCIPIIVSELSVLILLGCQNLFVFIFSFIFEIIIKLCHSWFPFFLPYPPYTPPWSPSDSISLNISCCNMYVYKQYTCTHNLLSLYNVIFINNNLGFFKDLSLTFYFIMFCILLFAWTFIYSSHIRLVPIVRRGQEIP